MERKHLITALATMGVAAAFTGSAFATAVNIPIVNGNLDQVYASAANYQTSITNPLAAVTATIPSGVGSSGTGTTTFSSALSYSDGTQSTAGYVPGWSGGSVAADGSAGKIPAGTYIQGYYFSSHQILSTDVQPNTTYTLTANIGQIYLPSSTYYYGDNLDLSYGASGSGSTFKAGTNLAGFNVKGTQTSGSGGYRPAYQSYDQVVFTATTGASASGALAIELGNYGSPHAGLTAFDGITLTAAPAAAVPEAPTLALLGLGALALLSLRRKRA